MSFFTPGASSKVSKYRRVDEETLEGIGRVLSAFSLAALSRDAPLACRE
jgi:hypothetical protein